jgi:hypothetical protein
MVLYFTRITASTEWQGSAFRVYNFARTPYHSCAHTDKNTGVEVWWWGWSISRTITTDSSTREATVDTWWVLRFFFFFYITRRLVVIVYRRFGTAYQPHFQGSRMREEMSSRLLITTPRAFPCRIYVTVLAFFPSRNLDPWRWDWYAVPKQDAAQYPRRAHSSWTPLRKPEIADTWFLRRCMISIGWSFWTHIVSSAMKTVCNRFFLVVKGLAADATAAPQPWGFLCNPVMTMMIS